MGGAFYHNAYDAINELIQVDSVDWSVVIEQSIKHKLLPLMWCTFKNCPDFDKIPFYIRDFMSNHYYSNANRTKLTYQHIQKITSIFEEHNVKYAVVKGLVLENQIYRNQCIKQIFDVDFVIDQKEYERVCVLLASHHILSGRMDYLTNTYKPHSRKEYLLFQLTKDHLPEHLVLTGDSVYPVIKIDITTNSDWINKGEESSNNFLAPDQLMNCEVTKGINIPTLRYEYHFLYIILHLYRHAWSYRLINRNISIRLHMFNDILLFWLNYKDFILQPLSFLLEEDDELRNRVSWVLQHTDRLFGTTIANELGCNMVRDDLNCAFGKNNQIVCWNGSIQDRLWSEKEDLLFLKWSDNNDFYN